MTPLAPSGCSPGGSASTAGWRRIAPTNCVFVVDLRAMTLAEAESFATSVLGAPRFRGEQIWRWVHRSRVRAVGEMVNLPKGLRERLQERAQLGCLTVDTVQQSADGTRKLRLVTRDQRFIETVLIPDGDKLTQCISSQV